MNAINLGQASELNIDSVQNNPVPEQKNEVNQQGGGLPVPSTGNVPTTTEVIQVDNGLPNNISTEAMGSNEKPAKKQSAYKDVQNFDDFIGKFKQMGSTSTSNVNIEDAVFDLNNIPVSDDTGTLNRHFKAMTLEEVVAEKTETEYKNKVLRSHREMYLTDLSTADKRGLDGAAQVENVDVSHHVKVVRDDKTGQLYQEGYNGRCYLGFIYSKSGDKVGTHEYANGTMKFGKLGTYFLRVDTKDDLEGGAIVNKYGIDAFLEPLVFEKITKKTSDTFEDAYRVKTADAGYRFTHVNKRSTKSDHKDLDALKLETVGGHRYRFWEKAVSKFTGMDDKLHMKAVRTNFAAALYDELRFDGVSVPDEIMDGFIGKILTANFAANGSNQNQSLILRKSEVAESINYLTEQFKENKEGVGNSLFNQYVGHNMSRMIADAYHVRCSPNEYQGLIKDLLPEDQRDQWSPQAIFQRIRTKTDPNFAGEIAAIEAEIAAAKSEKDASTAVKNTHRAYAKLFQVYLKGLQTELARFNSLINIKAASDTLNGLVELAQKPQNYKQGFMIVPGEAREQIRKLLNGALTVAINKVGDEGVRTKLQSALTEGLDIFCKQKSGAPDFLALELQRIALKYKNVDLTTSPLKMGEILNEIAKTALEFINGYRTHYEDIRKTDTYVKQRAKLTQNASKVVKALAKYVEGQTAEYLVQYKTAKTEGERLQILSQYEKFHGTCKKEDIKGEKLDLKVLTEGLPDQDDPDKLKTEATNKIKSQGLQNYQFVDVNLAYDDYLKNSYFDYFKERMYTGADLVNQVKNAYDEQQQKKLGLEKEVEGLSNKLKENDTFIVCSENDIAQWKAIKPSEYTKERYPALVAAYPAFDDLQAAIKDLEATVAGVKAEQEKLPEEINALKSQIANLKSDLAFADARVDEDLSFESYLSKRGSQKQFDRSMVKKLGETYAALTTFKPMKGGYVTVNQALKDLTEVYARQLEDNRVFISNSVQKKESKFKQDAISARKDPNAPVVKSGLSSFSLRASGIAEAFAVCIGSKSSDSTFKDKFNSIFYAVFGHQFGNDDGPDAIENKISEMVTTFGLRTYQVSEPSSLFNSLFNGWTKHLVSKHNEGTLDLFDDLLTLSENATEDEIVSALQNNYLQTQTIKTELGGFDLAQTLPTVQKQIVSVCLDSLKGVSTNFFNFFEKSLVFNHFSGETYAKAKKFRNALTNMTDEQLWSMCSGENETKDHGIPPEYRNCSSSKRKAFRQTMEAICEYRFMANSISAIEKAIATFAEMLPSRENEFLEVVKMSSEKSEIFNVSDSVLGRQLNKKGLSYLSGIVNNAVDSVVAQELERAASTFVEVANQKDTNDLLKKRVDDHRRKISKAVLQATIVGEMFNLNALSKLEGSNLLDKIGVLYQQNGNQWLVENYPMIAQIYGENIDLLALALEQGVLKDMYNVSVVDNIKAAKKDALSIDLVGRLTHLVTGDVADKAPKNILKFMDEVEDSLSTMTEQGKKFYLDNYKKFIVNKEKSPNYLQENAGQFAVIEDLLKEANVPENQREELRNRLISHAVERLMGQDEDIAGYIKDSLNYAHFDSFRKNMSQKLKLYMETNRHDFVKGVTANVLTILDEVKVILSQNNQNIAGQLNVNTFAGAFDTFVTAEFVDNAVLAKSQVLTQKIDSGNSVEKVVRDNINLLVEQDINVDVSQLMESNVQQIRGSLGLNKVCTSYGELLKKLTGLKDLKHGENFFAKLTENPGFKDLAEYCLRKVQENAQRDPVRYYGQLMKQFNKDEGFDVSTLTAAMRKDAVEMFVKLLPQYSQAMARIDAAVGRRMEDLKAKRYLYEKDPSAFDEQIDAIKGQVRAQMLAQLELFSGYVETSREELTAKRLDKVNELKDGVKGRLEGKVVATMDFSGLAYVDDLEVEDAALDRMAGAVVAKVYESEGSSYRKLHAEAMDRLYAANRDFAEKNVSAFAKLVDDARTQAEKLGLSGANLEQFVTFVKGIAQPETASANRLMDAFLSELKHSQPTGDLLGKYVEKLIGEFGVGELTTESVIDNKAQLLKDIPDLQAKLKTYVKSEQAQETLLNALKQKFLQSLPSEVKEVLLRDKVAEDKPKAIEDYEELIVDEANRQDENGKVRDAFISSVKAKIDTAFSETDPDGLFTAVFGAFFTSTDKNATVKTRGNPPRIDPDCIAALRRAIATFGLDLPDVSKLNTTANEKGFPTFGEVQEAWKAKMRDVIASAKEPLQYRSTPLEKTVEETVANLVNKSLSHIITPGVESNAIPDINAQIISRLEEQHGTELPSHVCISLGHKVCEFYRDQIPTLYAEQIKTGVENVAAAITSFFTAKDNKQAKINRFFDNTVCPDSKAGDVNIPFAKFVLFTKAFYASMDDYSMEQIYQQIFWPKEIADANPDYTFADVASVMNLEQVKELLRNEVFEILMDSDAMESIRKLDDGLIAGFSADLVEFDETLNEMKTVFNKARVTEETLAIKFGIKGKAPKFKGLADYMNILVNGGTVIEGEGKDKIEKTAVGIFNLNMHVADNIALAIRSTLMEDMQKSQSLDLMMSSMKGALVGGAKIINGLSNPNDKRRKTLEKKFMDKGDGPYQFTYGRDDGDWSGKLQCAEFAGIYAACSKLKGKYVFYHLFKNTAVAADFAKNHGLADRLETVLAKIGEKSMNTMYENMTKSGLQILAAEKANKNKKK